jgi:4-amino-4-deoxy-L-arabinose transferase-like glycosyltransferase
MSRKAKKVKPPNKAVEKHFRFPSSALAVGLGVLGAALIILGLNTHGLTYDEPIYSGFGRKAATWLVGIFGGNLAGHFSAEAINRAWFGTIDMQPPLVQVLSGLSQLLFGNVFGGLLPSRLPTALFFGLAVGATFRLTEKAFGRAAALFGSLALMFLPNFFAHAHYATLDVPVSALIITTAAVFYTAANEGGWKKFLLSGILLGLGLLTKLNVAFLVFWLLLWLVIFRPKLFGRAIIGFALAPLIFFIGWPWLWHDTFAHLGDYLGFHLRHYPVLVYYLGHIYKYAPWHYPFLLTGVTVPTLILLFLLGGGVNTVGTKRTDSACSARWLLLICGLGFLLPSALPFAPKYNGVRLFLPAFPFLMGLAGGGFAWLLASLTQRLEKRTTIAQLRPKLALLLALSLLPGAVAILRLYPYELAYYNALIGGPAGAKREGLETIYWGGVYLAGLPGINSRPEQNPKIFITPAGVVDLLKIYQNSEALRKDIKWVAPPAPAEGADWAIFQCAQSEFDASAWKLYRAGKPAPESIYLDEARQVPLLLFFSGEEARRVLGSKP